MPSRSWRLTEILPPNRCSTGRISKPVAAKPVQKEVERQATGRSCNDRTTKIQAFVDGLGRSVALRIASGQRAMPPSHGHLRSRTCAVNDASGRCSSRQRRHQRAADRQGHDPERADHPTRKQRTRPTVKPTSGTNSSSGRYAASRVQTRRQEMRQARRNLTVVTCLAAINIWWMWTWSRRVR